MMMALDPHSVLDRSMSKPQRTDSWAVRRWSLRGTPDTRRRRLGLTGQLSPPPARPSPRPAPLAAAAAPPPRPPFAPPSTSSTNSNHDTEKRKRSRSRSVDLSPLQSSLKRAPAALGAKLAQCAEAIGLKEALHRYKHKRQHATTTTTTTAEDDEEEEEDAQGDYEDHDATRRRVRFAAPRATQVVERPTTSAAEKAQYHYSRHELLVMLVAAKEALAREPRFGAQPAATVLEQGFLALPHEHHLFFQQPKRLYCLLTARELLGFASPAHAAQRVHVKCRLAILKVEECAAMSSQAKIAAFGAHLPASMALLFFVTKACGQRVLLAAESRAATKSWVHTLQQLTQVHEPLPPCVTCVTRQTSTSTFEDGADEDADEQDEDEKKEATPDVHADAEETPEETPGRNACARAAPSGSGSGSSSSNNNADDDGAACCT